jgi:chromatin remodeling complex protein RSC6
VPARFVVERGQRLVEHQQRRASGQRADGTGPSGNRTLLGRFVRRTAGCPAGRRRDTGAGPNCWKMTMATKKTPAPKAEAAPSGGKANALQKPLQPSKELAAVVGAGPLPRAEVVSKVWEYIKKHNLQNPKNKREILADDKLEAVFGKKKVTMFEMNKHIAQHLK